MRVGFIGLGRMGNRMVVKLLSEGHEVVVWNRSRERISSFQLMLSQGLKSQISNFKFKGRLEVAGSIDDLVKKLQKPRIIWLMVPQGNPTEEVLGEIQKLVEAGDIIIDGGNSHFEDTQRRYEEFTKRGILFLGIGVSGGIIAAGEGYPLMVGGDRPAYDQIRPILDSLAKPNGGHEYFGQGGAGHFVKMVHNGIEYGIMQSIGEGFGVLEKSPYKLDLVKIAKLYQKGTLVSGFMMQRTIEALDVDPKLSGIVGYIEDTGEGRWTIEQAKEENVPVEIIEASLKFREKSRRSAKVASTFAARLVAALRQAFGGHQIKKNIPS